MGVQVLHQHERHAGIRGHIGEEFRKGFQAARGGADTDELRRRLLAERQILASLSHPNIAALQEKLGAINDHATAKDQLNKWLSELEDPEATAALQDLIELETRSLAECQSQFVGWWTREQSDSLRRDFARALTSFPQPRRPSGFGHVSRLAPEPPPGAESQLPAQGNSDSDDEESHGSAEPYPS